MKFILKWCHYLQKYNILISSFKYTHVELDKNFY